MSNSENTEVTTPIVKVESSSLASTSLDRPTDESFKTQSDENSSTSSDESMITGAGQAQPSSLDIGKGQSLPTRLDIDDGIIKVMSVQTQICSSFDGLTIPVANPVDLRFPGTTYADGKVISLITRDLPNPNTLQGGCWL